MDAEKSNGIDNLRTLMQLVDAMEDAVDKLEKGYERGEFSYVEKAKKFMMDVQQRISLILK